MASKRFSKDTEEFMMFQEFWQLCQKYWEPEDNDSYWENVAADSSTFTKKYSGSVFAKEVSMAFLTSLDIKSKEIEDGKRTCIRT
jgi:hypothetical protein